MVRDAQFQASKPKYKPIIEWFMPPILSVIWGMVKIIRIVFFSHIHEYQQHVVYWNINVYQHVPTLMFQCCPDTATPRRRSWKRCHCCRETRLDWNRSGGDQQMPQR